MQSSSQTKFSPFFREQSKNQYESFIIFKRNSILMLLSFTSGYHLKCRVILQIKTGLSCGTNYSWALSTFLPLVFQFSSVQFSHSVMSNSATPWTSAHQASLFITNSWSLLKLMSIKLVMSSNHLILCHPLLLLPSIFPSIRVFSSEAVLHIRRPKYWSFSFSISPSNEYSGPISFRMNWLDLPAVQVTLKNLLQHHSSKASILRCSAFFTVQLWVQTV